MVVALGRLRQEDQEYKASLGYRARSNSKKKKKRKRKKKDGWAIQGGCTRLGAPPYIHYPAMQVQGLLTWGSDPGAHSTARRAAATPLGSVGEQKAQPQPSKPLPCLAALCHLDEVGVQFAVEIAALRLRMRRYSQVTAGG
jgi:hypothetical protein